jgi:hypothetical protein
MVKHLWKNIIEATILTEYGKEKKNYVFPK